MNINANFHSPSTLQSVCHFVGHFKWLDGKVKLRVCILSQYSILLSETLQHTDDKMQAAHYLLHQNPYFQYYIQLCRFLLVKTSPCRICSCVGDVIDCDRKGLTGFHVTAALNSTKWKQLLLAHNKLTHVPDLRRFTQLRKLDLSHNRITGIPADAFSSLALLTELDLSMNMNFQLSDTGLPSAAFSGLKSLEILR